MDEKIVGEIIGEVFKKAKKEHASHSKFALSNHISNETDLSARTLERAYDRYINKKVKYGVPQAESIDLFCKYLGYEDFRDYVENKPGDLVIEQPPIKGTNKQKLIITISIAFGMILLFFAFQKWSGFRYNNNTSVDKCMTWADSIYIPISCNKGPLSKYGTHVKPLDKVELNNMRKVEVNATYKFFSEDGKPLVWYFKNKSNEHEFFTAPGLHPVNGETLRKITPYIIQNYVPMHLDKKESFIPE
ncbi:hypothetical protein [uncultured Croceitalea sp.]|uniref:hypothetical protein n=1 Tax=uncultured Croceitalea sp. TaxID=1798908 RepID=UPI00374F8EE6